MAEKVNRLMGTLGKNAKRAGNVLSFKTPGTPLDFKLGVAGLVDTAHRMLPAVGGGLVAKYIYQWGVNTFKAADASKKRFWEVATTDEGAGTLGMFLFNWLLLMFIPGDTTERFACGLMGRGSIVTWNTLMRWIGKPNLIRANQTSDVGMVDGIDITPQVMDEILNQRQPANQTVALPEGANPDLDEQLLREVGTLALKSPDFREKVSNGMARRVNEYMDREGRKQIDEEVVHGAMIDLFQAMAKR